MPETESSPAADSTLEDMLQDWFPEGNAQGESEPPAPSDPPEAVGAPPTEPAAPTEPAPADAPVLDPDAPALEVSTPPVEDDLPPSQPLTYTVNGESRSWGDIEVIPGHGAIIPEAALTQLQQRLSERDHLFETNQARHHQVEQLERMTSWQRTGANGQAETLTGAPALEAQRVEMARAVTALDVMLKAVTDPQIFAGLVTVNGAGQIVADPAALEHLLTRAELAQNRAEQQARQYFSTLAQPTPVTPQSNDIDWKVAAPKVLDMQLQQAGVQDVSAADRDYLTKLVPRYVRTATAEDVRANPQLKLGERGIDPEFLDIVKDRMALRSQSAPKPAAASQAERENQARLAAAARGKTVVKPHLRTVPSRQTVPNSPRRDASMDAAKIHEARAAGRWPDDLDDE